VDRHARTAARQPKEVWMFVSRRRKAAEYRTAICAALNQSAPPGLLWRAVPPGSGEQSHQDLESSPTRI